MQSLVELANKDIVNLLRRTGLRKKSTSNSSDAPEKKITPPLADDLPAYLRTLRRLLNTSEVADILGIHVETVYALINDKILPAKKYGSHWRIQPSKLADFIEDPDARREVAARVALDESTKQ